VSDDSSAGYGTAYWVGYCVTWVLIFLGWIYCIVGYGFLLGVGLGWLPSTIVATVAAFLWPVIIVVAFLLGWLFFHQ
jgi:hypothetical protein